MSFVCIWQTRCLISHVACCMLHAAFCCLLSTVCCMLHVLPVASLCVAGFWAWLYLYSWQLLVFHSAVAPSSSSSRSLSLGSRPCSGAWHNWLPATWRMRNLLMLPLQQLLDASSAKCIKCIFVAHLGKHLNEIALSNFEAKFAQ